MTLPKLVLLASLTALTYAQTPSSKEVENVYPDAHALYLDLHQNPELSTHETQTAAKLATHLRNAGYEVTEHVGGTGVVATLKNGPGPIVMLRTELDALLWRRRPAFLTPAKYAPKTMPGMRLA
jgi:metal-dependent amidase/aminoacylase/carboxypeptidase family protein